jgi:hypothetical protein
MTAKREPKFYPLSHKKHGVGGITLTKPAPRKQDRRARPGEYYSVVFFPKFKGLWPAAIHHYDVNGTISQSPEAARIKFMDRIAKGETWAKYSKAGWRIRKIKIVDLGDA